MTYNVISTHFFSDFVAIWLCCVHIFVLRQAMQTSTCNSPLTGTMLWRPFISRSLCPSPTHRTWIRHKWYKCVTPHWGVTHFTGHCLSAGPKNASGKDPVLSQLCMYVAGQRSHKVPEELATGGNPALHHRWLPSKSHAGPGGQPVPQPAPHLYTPLGSVPQYEEWSNTDHSKQARLPGIPVSDWVRAQRNGKMATWGSPPLQVNCQLAPHST